MLIWQCDTLRSPARTVDIGLMWDEANVATPQSGPRIENLAETVE